MAHLAFDHEILGRIGPFATIDIVGTVIPIYAISKYNGFSNKKTAFFIIGGLIFAEFTHHLFGIETPVTKKVKELLKA
jgi:hypothetical protein